MAIWIGLAMGSIFAAAGWAIYVFAPRIGPNPIFGVRTWYSMVNRDVWDQSNRTGGIVMVILGVLIVAATFVARLWVDPESEAGILTVVGIDLALTAVGVIWLVLYTRRLAKGVEISGGGVIRVSPLWLAPATLLTIAIVIFLIATYSSLPVDRVATHFDGNGVANDWMSRGGHLWFSIGTALGIFVLIAAIFLILTHITIPGAETWPIAGEPVLHFLSAMLLVVEAIMGIVFLDIYWFNTRHEHLASLGTITALIVGIVTVGTLVGLAYIIIYGRRIRLSHAS